MTPESVFEVNRSLMLGLARKYIWWQTPETALRNPYRVLERAMNLGTLEDYQAILEVFGEPFLADMLKKIRPGLVFP